MAYCQSVDILRYIVQLKLAGGDFSSTSTPTQDQVNDFIDDISNDIDNVLVASGIKLPIVANDYLRKLNALGASGLVSSALKTGGENQNDTARDFRMKQYDDMLTMLKSNPRLSGATILASNGQEFAQSDVTRGDTPLCRRFSIFGRNW